MKIYRRISFNAAHRLFVREWSDEKNFEVFGKCSNPNYHGHNYTLVACLEGSIDPTTGYVFDLGKLNSILKKEIVDRFDHRNFNLDSKEFENLNPTAENIACVFWQLIRQQIPNSLKLSIKLHETENNWVEFDGNE